MRATTQGPASWGEHSKKLRRSANRKLRQRRAWRARLTAPDWQQLSTHASTTARRIAPMLGVLAGVAIAAVVLSVAHHFVTHSDRFALRASSIRITGNARVTREALLARAHVDEGTNVFAIALPDIERKLAADPWIEEAQVTRELPDGLRIHIRERQPVALLIAEAPYLIDREGLPFKRADLSRGEGDGLVVITGVPREAFSKAPDVAALAIRDALAITTNYHTVAARPPIGEINISRSGYTLYTLEGAVALRLGRATGDELAARLRRFDATWLALSDSERAVAKTIWLDSTARTDRVTVSLAEAR